MLKNITRNPINGLLPTPLEKRWLYMSVYILCPMQRISSETAACKLFRPSLFRRSLAAICSLTRNFFRRRADRFRQKIVEIGGILAIFVFGNHTLSLLETTHCPVWKAHIVLFGKHTFSCLANTDSLVWRAHILLFGKHTFSCFESTHSLVWKAPHRV